MQAEAGHGEGKGEKEKVTQGRKEKSQMLIEREASKGEVNR